jgi:hypothetical protein
MSQEANEITIIAGPQSVLPAQSLEYLPPEGEGVPHGELQGLPSFITKRPIDKLTGQIEALRGQLATLVKSLAQSVSENTELEEITIGLAVSVEGDIGIASAGAEASIELTFKVKR